MGLWDWVEITTNQTGTGGGSNWASKDFAAFENAIQGTVTVSLGDQLAAVLFGGIQGHTFGDYAYLTVDYDGLIEDMLGSVPGLGTLLNGPLGALICGLGGNVNWNYGRVTAANYVGPVMNINRAPTRKATGLSYLWAGQGSSPGRMPADLGSLVDGSSGALTPGNKKGAQKAIDRTSGVVVAILSILMVLTALALDLLIYFKQKYPDLPHLPGNNDPGPQGTIQLLKDCVWTITTRLMALIAYAEHAAQVARDAVQKFQSADQLTSSEKWALSPTAVIRMKLSDAKERLSDAWQNAEQTTKDAIICVAIIVAFLGVAAAVIGGTIAAVDK